MSLDIAIAYVAKLVADANTAQNNLPIYFDNTFQEAEGEKIVVTMEQITKEDFQDKRSPTYDLLMVVSLYKPKNIGIKKGLAESNALQKAIQIGDSYDDTINKSALTIIDTSQLTYYEEDACFVFPFSISSLFFDY